MEEENILEQSNYLSYNSLNRPAMLGGVPLMMIVVILAMFFFVCFPLYMFFGKIVGSIPTIFLVITLILTKLNCENDPNAMTVLLLKIKGFIKYGFKRILGVRG